MKKLIIASLVCLSTVAFSQVAIGKTSVSSPSSSLEFGNSGVGADITDPAKQKGIVLPWVSTVADQPVAGYQAMSATEHGTLIFDLSDDK